MPGQTLCPSPRKTPATEPFNGGPGNCPAKRPSEATPCGAIPPFNGGPGNCPAKPESSHPPAQRAPAFNGGPGNCPAKRDLPPRGLGELGGGPSMEGRAIARPNNPASPGDRARASSCLQWRAGQLPGQTIAWAAVCNRRGGLQWRAGQLPGQTGRERGRGGSQSRPSMEGRAIARPNM